LVAMNRVAAEELTRVKQHLQSLFAMTHVVIHVVK
jgi:hypothetical protein